MRLNRIIASTLMAATLCSSLCAQDLSVASKRAMNKAVIDKVYDLELYSTVDSKTARYNFIRLFESDTAPIFCDVSSNESYLKETSAREYADFMMGSCKDASVSFSDVSKGKIRKVGSEWLYDITLSKSLTYVDENEVLHPFTETEPYRLEITFSFSGPTNDCRIKSIKCLNASDFSRGRDFYVVQKHFGDSKDVERDEKVEIGGKTLKYNSFKQAYAPRTEISFWDDDIKVVKDVLGETAEYQYIQLKYIPKHLRLRLRNNLALGGAYSVTGAEGFSKNESSGYEAGLDFGYSFPLGSGVKFALYTGLGISMTSLDFATSSSYERTISESVVNPQTGTSRGVEYIRAYNLEDISQGISAKDLLVPLYMSLGFRLAKGVSLFVDAGAKAYFNTNAHVDPFHIRGAITRINSDGTTLDGFQLDRSYNDFISAVAFKRKSVDLSLAGYVGLDINVYKRLLFLEVKAGYETAISDSYSSENNAFADSDMLPLVYDATTGEDVVMHPLADCVSFKRQAIWAGLGLMIKF